MRRQSKKLVLGFIRFRMRRIQGLGDLRGLGFKGLIRQNSGTPWYF